MKRRDFIKKSILGTAGALLACNTGCVESQTKSKSRYFEPAETVTLGKTGIKTSRVCLGTGMKGWNRQSNQTRLGKEKFHALIRDAYERGVRMFDLADIYGSHPYIVPALKDINRKNYVIVTKIWWRKNGIPETARPDADIVAERFMKELKTDYIDILHLHCVESAKWPGELERQMNILAKLKKKGIIRAHGVSCHSLDALKAAAREPWVDVTHARFNPYQVRMDGPPEVVAPVLKEMRQAGKAVVGMKIIGEGEFRNSDEKRDHSVNFALTSGCVDVLNVGFEKTEEIDDLAARIKKVPRTV